MEKLEENDLLTNKHILLTVLHYTSILAARVCEFDAEGQCSGTESCNEATNTCQCLPGYERGNETHCVPFSPEPDSTPNYSSLVDNQEGLDGVYGRSSPSYSVMKEWAKPFRIGHEFLEDDERPGRPVEVITEDKVALVEELVLSDRRLKNHINLTDE
nr:unnamed protein product [Callosobruchus analis]